MTDYADDLDAMTKERNQLQLSVKVLKYQNANWYKIVGDLARQLGAAEARIAELELEVNQAAGCTVYEKPKLVCPVCRRGNHAWADCDHPGCTDGRNLVEPKS